MCVHTPQHCEPLQELAHRLDHELDVTPFWDRGQHCALLCISDQSSGAYLVSPIDEERALDAYRHPSRYLPSMTDWQRSTGSSDTSPACLAETSES
jgi:hypothetical protein